MNPQLQESVSGRYLSSGEREDIALWRAQGAGVRAIARRLKRAPSTISRELRRNASTRTYRLDYKASTAQWHAERRARRPKMAKLVANDRLRQYVQDKLSGVVRGANGQVVVGPAGTPWKGRNKPHRGDRAWVTAWSPEQIARRLPVDFPDDETMRISHEAIYQALYVETRGALKRDLVSCLRRGRALRVPQARTRQKAWAHVTPETLISQRPPEVADRAVPGHWEGDLLIGLQRSAIGTLVERSSRFTMLIHLPREDGYGVTPRTKNGPALAGYGALTMATALDPNHHHTARAVTPVIDLGPRQGTVGSRPVLDHLRGQGVLRRPQEPLAARHERKHQRPFTPILSEGHRPVPLERRRHRSHRSHPQHPTPQSPRLANTLPKPSTNTYTRYNKPVLRRPS